MAGNAQRDTQRDDSMASGGGLGLFSHLPEQRIRVAKACESCRQRRVKCSGDRPACQHCRTYGFECKYELSRKRNRAQDEITELRQINTTYQQLLRNILPHLPQGPASAVTEALRQTNALGSPSRSSGDDPFDADADEVSSLHSLDAIEEDFNTIDLNRPEGFIGPATDVAFVRAIISKLNEKDHAPSAHATPGRNPDSTSTSISRHPDIHTTFHLDDVKPGPDPSTVETSILPSRHLADIFLERYWGCSHIVFPFLDRRQFMERYDTFWDEPPPMVGQVNTFRALVNIVLAIGAYQVWRSEPLGEGIPSTSADASPKIHEELYARAQICAGNLEEVGRLMHIQYVLLCALFLTSMDRPNRAWNTIGLAVRLAYGIGLNLKNEAMEGVTEVQKETRNRTWWSIYCLEFELSHMLSRPPCISDSDVFAALPREIDDEYLHADGNIGEQPPSQRSYVSFLLSETKYVRIITDATRKLHSVQASHTPWNIIQQNIMDAERELKQWNSSLPDILKFDVPGSSTSYGAGRGLHSGPHGPHSSHTPRRRPDIEDAMLRFYSPTFKRLRFALELQYYNARIWIMRVCLSSCSPRSGETHAHDSRFDVDAYAARACIDSAVATISAMESHHAAAFAESGATGVVPEREAEAAASLVMTSSAWWVICFYLMSAAVVLVAALVIDPDRERKDELHACVEKCTRLYERIGRTQESARRCLRIVQDLRRAIAEGGLRDRTREGRSGNAFMDRDREMADNEGRPFAQPSSPKRKVQRSDSGRDEGSAWPFRTPDGSAGQERHSQSDLSLSQSNLYTPSQTRPSMPSSTTSASSAPIASATTPGYTPYHRSQPNTHLPHVPAPARIDPTPASSMTATTPTTTTGGFADARGRHLPPPIPQVPLGSPVRIQPSLIPTLPPYSSIHHHGGSPPGGGGGGGEGPPRAVPNVLHGAYSPSAFPFDPGHKYGQGGPPWPYQQVPYPGSYQTQGHGSGPQAMNMAMGMNMGMGNPAWTGQVQWAPPAPSHPHSSHQRRYSQPQPHIQERPVRTQSQSSANLNVNLNLPPTTSRSGAGPAGQGPEQRIDQGNAEGIGRTMQGVQSPGMGSRTSGSGTMSSATMSSTTMMQSAGSAETIRPGPRASHEER
ncbi:hypothetical protein SAICODRAFT_25572 [Saitoella complicata NRRL Y-17804]|uniref:uncharacterized protein n=1 Tax=Saitoella complicata (strain BCRC 22490 / CBS 7301 / JCM 7358 / NBRC 10748 / NRRL Y-17804) TaxID=698492 RepID=UPI000868103F|nr:uncharacterized protein SAICODRAFT_25572 [Saitoella complicata NRRL Y-17804]ODQ53077.1 hypothetical protein SAICODRAFT_25572 [Saitoella complicata NRRL Y-17804]